LKGSWTRSACQAIRREPGGPWFTRAPLRQPGLARRPPVRSLQLSRLVRRRRSCSGCARSTRNSNAAAVGYMAYTCSRGPASACSDVVGDQVSEARREVPTWEPPVKWIPADVFDGQRSCAPDVAMHQPPKTIVDSEHVCAAQDRTNRRRANHAAGARCRAATTQDR
jgi:hypothetical protein